MSENIGNGNGYGSDAVRVRFEEFAGSMRAYMNQEAGGPLARAARAHFGASDESDIRLVAGSLIPEETTGGNFAEHVDRFLTAMSELRDLMDAQPERRTKASLFFPSLAAMTARADVIARHTADEEALAHEEWKERLAGEEYDIDLKQIPQPKLGDMDIAALLRDRNITVRYHAIRTIDRLAGDPARALNFLKLYIEDLWKEPVASHDDPLAFAIERLLEPPLVEHASRDYDLRDKLEGRLQALVRYVVELIVEPKGYMRIPVEMVAVAKALSSFPGALSEAYARTMIATMIDWFGRMHIEKNDHDRERVVETIFYLSTGIRYLKPTKTIVDALYEIMFETPLWLGSAVVAVRRQAELKIAHRDERAIFSRANQSFWKEHLVPVDDDDASLSLKEMMGEGRLVVLEAPARKLLAEGNDFDRITMVRYLQRAGFVAHRLIPDLQKLADISDLGNTFISTEPLGAKMTIEMVADVTSTRVVLAHQAAHTAKRIAKSVTRRVNVLAMTVARAPHDPWVVQHALDELASYGPRAAHALPVLEGLAPVQGIHVFTGVCPMQLAHTIQAIRPAI